MDMCRRLSKIVTSILFTVDSNVAWSTHALSVYTVAPVVAIWSDVAIFVVEAFYTTCIVTTAIQTKVFQICDGAHDNE